MDFGPWTLDFKDTAATTVNAGGIIERTEKAFFVREQFHDLFLVPQMIATGNDVHAGGKNFLGGLGRDAGATGGVFTIGDDEIERVSFAKFGQKFLDRAPAGLPASSSRMPPLRSESFSSSVRPKCSPIIVAKLETRSTWPWV